MGAVLHGPYHRYASALGLALIVVHSIGVLILAVKCGDTSNGYFVA